MIRLETLGRLPAAGQPKRIALLTYLALARPRGEQRRDTLLALLWPDLDAGRGRAALRQTLYALRKNLGADVVRSSGTEGVSIDPAFVTCDVWDLEDAAARGDHDRALEIYGGDVVAGLFVSDAPAFEHWLDAERSYVRHVVRQSAWAAAEAALAAGDAARVATRVRMALGLSSFDEAAIRRGMRLLAAAGERAAAIALYERFAAETRAELDAEPSAATRGLADELRHANVALAFVESEPAPVPRTPRPASRTRTPHRATRVVVAASAIVVAITAAARMVSGTGATDPRRIRVEPIDNVSRLPELDSIAALATSRVRGALVAVGDVRVASSTSRNDHAGTLVRGALRRSGGRLVFRGEVIDRASGTLVRSVSAAGTDADSVTSVFADRLDAAVATALYPGWGAALSQPASYASYRLFVDGMRNIKREQHDAAIASFRRAFDDSSFTAAGLLAASELYQVKRYAAAESIVVAVARRRADLPAIDARLLDWIERSLHGDRIGARAAMQAVVMLAPQADLAWLQLAIDNVETARPAEALDALSHIDRDAEFGESWPAYWATYAEALHIAGDRERELATTREGLRRHPETRVLINYELRALAALGRVADVDAGVRALAAATVSGGIDPAVTMRQVALELAAHGHTAAAQAMFARVRASFEAAPPRDSAGLLGFRLGRARTAFLSEDRSGARANYDSLLREYPRCLDCIGALGVLAARDGDRRAAQDAVQHLGASRAPYLYGRQYLWQSRILSALGDVDAAARSLNTAFGAGNEFDVMTHTDPDLRRLKPDSMYRVFARAGN